jgi:hypothetical protein
LTTSGHPAEPRIQRARLGSELRRLRKLSSPPGKMLASQVEVGQAGVSSIAS